MASAIPKIIHQTWKTTDIPEGWRAYVQSWKDLHPDWEYRLWTDEANRAFVEEHYPEFLANYDAYPFAIQRADAVRYCLLHYFGGVYIDLDIECLRPLDDLIVGNEFIAVPEPDEQAIALDRKFVISNAFMASRPGHAYLEAILGRIIANPQRGITHGDVLAITGPLMISDVFDTYTGGGVSILRSQVTFPFDVKSGELRVMKERWPGHEALRQQIVESGTYAVHYWANSWTSSLSGELINPTPNDIDGFEFFSGLDSPDNDIANVGRDIRLAAIACKKIDAGVAFNTDGFVKDSLWPQGLWQPMGNGAANEGLYVRKKQSILRKLLPRWLR